MRCWSQLEEDKYNKSQCASENIWENRTRLTHKYDTTHFSVKLSVNFPQAILIVLRTRVNHSQWTKKPSLTFWKKITIFAI